ncbi:MAG TPA: hypothetical protein VEM95_04730, partial [Thermoplasmata archaeon]|nr:hypothetical protein [Thermoplasmata archaeon]
MANWVTYLNIEMNPGSANPAEIVNKLVKLGWKPVWGDWDFAWDWGSKWAPNGNNKAYWDYVEKTYTVLKSLHVDWSYRT